MKFYIQLDKKKQDTCTRDYFGYSGEKSPAENISKRNVPGSFPFFLSLGELALSLKNCPGLGRTCAIVSQNRLHFSKVETLAQRPGAIRPGAPDP